ncbi:hypothetical protein N7463_002308 [Penicillium fimorum]|uniref:Uncharacterized protein n=1 Tax=Penicillium fimorum TaxID=1882269 RepID=A0A9W9XZ03_9EURO|nr:hypothetical protein N7463_002308 [Penicillium fimorum]
MDTAVASSLCEVTIGMIKDTQSQISVEFPGHDSFATIMQPMTCGDPEKAKSIFGLSVSRLKPGGTLDQTSTRSDVV